jgi:cGMP-dependent 3',5'-cyclic phosphodiesterase
MERHHFAQSMCILNTEGCNILENITKQVITIFLKELSRELDWDFDDINA